MLLSYIKAVLKDAHAYLRPVQHILRAKRPPTSEVEGQNAMSISLSKWVENTRKPKTHNESRVTAGLMPLQQIVSAPEGWREKITSHANTIRGCG